MENLIEAINMTTTPREFDTEVYDQHTQAILNNWRKQYVTYQIFNKIMKDFKDSFEALKTGNLTEDGVLEGNMMFLYLDFDGLVSNYYILGTMKHLSALNLVNLITARKNNRFLLKWYRFFEHFVKIMPMIERRLKTLNKI